MVHGVAKSQTGLSDFTFLSFVFLGKNPFPIDRNVITEVALNTGFRSRFVCSMYNNPNVGVLRFVAEKVFIQSSQVRRWENKSQISFPEGTGWRYLSDKEAMRS